ncbi:hypothetical protein BH23ACT2_BH23ACT2_31380 [soil metagenome]
MTAPICIIHHPGGTTELIAGDDVSFGRMDPKDHIGAGHIGVSANPRLHARAGTVAVDETGWTLHNTGRWLHLRVNPVGRADRTDVAPGRSLRVPWSEARVEVVTGDETVGLTVVCPLLADAPRTGPLPAGDTVGGLGLDRSAGYFRAAVALCAPRLRDPSSTEIASVAQVARALGGAPGEPERVTQKAVERRLAHLRTRLDIGGEDPTGTSAAGLEVRDAGRQLVDLLIRTGTVTPADLTLIDDTTADAEAPGP